MPSKPQYLSSMEASEDVAAAAAAASAAGESHTSTLGSGGSSSSHAYGSMMMSSAGSVPVQMPGRSYYKYRSASAAGGAHHQGPGGHQPMSLTQSHIDIREGEEGGWSKVETNEEGYRREENHAISTSNAPP